MDVSDMNQMIRRAVARTFGFKGWSFANEFEFKHELFHWLAQEHVDGVPLCERAPGHPSCRLHVEAKPVNGRPQKADLLLCDPTRRMGFNYEPQVLVELKQRLSSKTISEELAKLQAYGRSFDALYLAAPGSANDELEQTEHAGTRVYLLHPGCLATVQGADFVGDEGIQLETAVGLIRMAVDATLLRYGSGRSQFHSFFWCNYEHELSRGHSYPCEGDFNAQLYHALRLKLPASVEIRSEVHPVGESRQRVDFLIADRQLRWAIPIEVKMNWDQFKPAFRDGARKTPEAVTIVNRLKGASEHYPAWQRMLIVVQGHWAMKRDVRSQALPILERCSYPLELVMYDELTDRIVRRIIGASNVESPIS